MNTNSMIVLCLVLFSFILLACTKNYDSEIYTFQEVFENKEDLIGKNIIIKAAIKSEPSKCTLMGCPTLPSCCNHCSATLFLVENASITTTEFLNTPKKLETNKNCDGNECIMNCEIEPNKSYLISGSLKMGEFGCCIFEIKSYDEDRSNSI